MWKHNGKLIEDLPEDTKGFIYMITNKINGEYYIGKKQIYNTRTVKLSKKKSTELYSGKGRKPTKAKKVSESDWKTYTGSNKRLNADVTKFGAIFFKFDILEFCPTLSLLKYREAEYQFKHNCLFDDTCYNEWIQIKTHRKHLK